MKLRTGFSGAIIITIISALVYLPLINRLGYTHDDWYLMAAAHAEGPNVFREIFSVDRPGRALVMIPAYKLFDENPLYYNLSAYVFRVLGALALLGLLNTLWPQRTTLTNSMALLFLIYPGFLSQPNGIDYQSHIVGLAAALLSIWLTVLAVLSPNRIKKTLWYGLSILLGWLSLSQMEWYIGFEFLRWACVFLLASRQGGTLLHKGLRAFQAAYLSLAVPGVFLIWRIFFFHSERGATDVDLQFGDFRLYPFQTVFHWIIQVAQDSMDVTLSAWVIPISQLMGYIQRWGGIIALLLTGLCVFLFYKGQTKDAIETVSQPFDFHREATYLGIFTILGGLLPIAMVNREVAFPDYSRYSLVSSAGAAIFIIVSLARIQGKILRNGLFAGLCFIAILTQHANTVQYVQETAATRSFWWQVAWRVPQFEKNATLIADYPGVSLLEDYFVWGPANLIYYPTKQNPKVIQPGLFSAILSNETVLNVLTRERQKYDNRKQIITYTNYRDIIILSQPSSGSCLHVIDGTQPEYSLTESNAIRTIGSFSKIEKSLADQPPHTPPALVFGTEPSHSWCYYYEKADLARQQGNWDEVIAMGEKAFALGLAPQDSIEWFPFLEAYVHTGNVNTLTKLAHFVEEDPYIELQACQILGSIPGVSATMHATISSLFCAAE